MFTVIGIGVASLIGLAGISLVFPNSAIGKLITTVGYLFTGRIDRVRRIWAKNADVISANFDNIVTEKRARLNHIKDAVGSLIAQEEKKKITLSNVTEETVKLEKLRTGALAKAKSVAAKYADNPEAAKSDPEYLKCQTAYRDFTSTLEEKQKRVGELEADVSGLSKTIAERKVSIDTLMRELEKIKSEKHETIADIISAEEEKKIADTFSGISEDKTANELQELRDLRTKAKADARMSRELAGMDSSKAEADFLNYATESAADTEFDKLIGLTKETSSDVSSAPTKIKEA